MFLTEVGGGGVVELLLCFWGAYPSEVWEALVYKNGVKSGFLK